ncbi:hypothetical protein EV363DRAFT_1449122 [Boletus edulis]|nr:hypothetical protein EV363DRAFT_1449122 [Boletus edulis]
MFANLIAKFTDCGVLLELGKNSVLLQLMNMALSPHNFEKKTCLFFLGVIIAQAVYQSSLGPQPPPIDRCYAMNPTPSLCSYRHMPLQVPSPYHFCDLQLIAINDSACRAMKYPPPPPFPGTTVTAPRATDKYPSSREGRREGGDLVWDKAESSLELCYGLFELSTSFTLCQPNIERRSTRAPPLTSSCNTTFIRLLCHQYEFNFPHLSFYHCQHSTETNTHEIGRCDCGYKHILSTIGSLTIDANMLGSILQPLLTVISLPFAISSHYRAMVQMSTAM